MASPAFMVYRITNLVNGKAYIGQTKNTPAVRFRQHVSGNAHCAALKAAIRKYGADSFSLETLCVCPDQDYADFVEREAIIHFGTLSPGGYNLRDGGTVLHGFSDESLLRVVKSAKARGISQACREAQIAAATGAVHSEESRAKRSAALLGRPRDPSVVAQIAASNTGKKRSEAVRANMRQARLRYLAEQGAV